MKTVVFDTNSYDELTENPHICELIRIAISHRLFKVIVPRTVAEELINSPHCGVPLLFPYEFQRHSVPLAGVMRAGDALGSVETFKSHLGNSKKANDALIADAAIKTNCDWLVSNDKRMSTRLRGLNATKGLTFQAFREEFQKFCDEHGISTRIVLVQKARLTAEQNEHITRRTAGDAKAGEAGPCNCWDMENWTPNLWAVVNSGSTLPIGAFHFAGPNDYMDVGWWMDGDYRGQRFGSEAIDRLALLLNARGVTKLANIRVEGNYQEFSNKLRTRLYSYFPN